MAPDSLKPAKKDNFLTLLLEIKNGHSLIRIKI